MEKMKKAQEQEAQRLAEEKRKQDAEEAKEKELEHELEVEREKQREMQALLMERQQLVQQPHGSRDRIYLEESQVNPQMAQDEQEFAKKLGAQKKKSQQNLAKLMSIGGKKAGKLAVDPAQQKKLEQAAIAQINQATLAGIKKGEEASKKLHADAKSQSEGETTEAIGKLKDKFDSTRNQVLAIVQNFG